MHDPKNEPELPELPDLPSLLPPAPDRSGDALDGGLGESPSLSLDTPASAPPTRSAPAFDPSILEDDDDMPLEVLDLAAPPRAVAPLVPTAPTSTRSIAATNAPAEPLAMDPIDVLALADFGSSPRGWVDAPFYTIRVYMRIRELRRELTRQRGLLVAAERGREHVLASFVEALKAGSSETSRALRERLLAVDQRAAERGAALETASQMYSTDVAQIDARIGELEAQRLTQETAVTEAEADLEGRAENRARAEARSKRVQIELRAAHDAARVAAGPDAKFAPPEHAKRIRDLDMEADVRATELRPLQQAFEDATEVTRARQAELRETRKQIAKLREDRRGLEKTASRQLDIRTAGAGEAERERFAAYAEAGRELLRAPGVVPVADANAANDAQRIVDERALSIEKYSRALTAYDAQGVRRGNVVLAVALVLTLALFAMVVVRLAS